MDNGPPQKRKRNHNFSEMEKMSLILAYEKYKDTMQQTIQSTDNNAQKNRCWRLITDAVNSGNTAYQRSIEEIRAKTTGLFVEARKASSRQKAHQRATGGGPAVPPLPPIYEIIIDRILAKETIEGIPGGVDSGTVMPESPYTTVSSPATPGMEASHDFVEKESETDVFNEREDNSDDAASQSQCNIIEESGNEGTQSHLSLNATPALTGDAQMIQRPQDSTVNRPKHYRIGSRKQNLNDDLIKAQIDALKSEKAKNISEEAKNISAEARNRAQIVYFQTATLKMEHEIDILRGQHGAALRHQHSGYNEEGEVHIMQNMAAHY